MLYLDANVILRYLLQDCEQFIAQSKEYVENNKAYIRNEVFAEVVYVLNKTYQVPKNEIANILKELLSLNTINIDFVDNLLCDYSKLLKINVVSFDKKLNKCMETDK